MTEFVACCVGCLPWYNVLPSGCLGTKTTGLTRTGLTSTVRSLFSRMLATVELLSSMLLLLLLLLLVSIVSGLSLLSSSLCTLE